MSDTIQDASPKTPEQAEACENDAALQAGLRLAKQEWEHGDRAAAVEVLGTLWEKTRSPEAADLLARLSRELVRSLSRTVEEDARVVARLAGLFRALHGENGVQVDTLQYDIIGGLALDTSTLIPLHKAGLTTRSGKKIAFFSGNSANPALVEMISRELPVVSDSSFGRLMPYCNFDWEQHRYMLSPKFSEDFFGRHAALFRDLVEFTHSTNGRDYIQSPEDTDVCRKCERPQISFTEHETELGERFLRETLKLPQGGWFVCVYARDGSYYGETPQSANWFRNADIATYLPAIDHILACGGHVVRVGSLADRHLEHQDPRVLDYAKLECRSPLLDVFLLSRCRFLLGTPSGLSHVCEAFGTPEFLVNTINVSMVPGAALYIPKLIRDARTGQLLRYEQFLERFYAHGDIGALYENGIAQRDELGVCYQDDSPEDIAAATRELLQRQAGTFREDAASARLRERFRALWVRFHAAMVETPIASSFLEAHPELF
ncbi:MAG: TIGR04372 family glycosyltransferase [Proteobacteria bacterium]|nr:TIGR04372 family glycosyltransferase [Pseudomonadota bacterium]